MLGGEQAGGIATAQLLSVSAWQPLKPAALQCILFPVNEGAWSSGSV